MMVAKTGALSLSTQGDEEIKLADTAPFIIQAVPVNQEGWSPES